PGEVRHAVDEVLVGDRVRDVVAHVLAAHLDRARGVVYLDRAIPLAEVRRSVLAEEEPLALAEVAADEIPHLLQLTPPVRDRDERRRDTRQLAEGAFEIRHVVEHEVRYGRVERVVGERQLLHVGDSGLDAAGARELDHVLGLVGRDDVEPGSGEALGVLAAAAADLQHARRSQREERVEGDVERGRPDPPRPQRLPAGEPGVVGVLAPDDLRVVLRAHDLRAPVSSSAAISSRIFSSERRMRRETCICEMPTCCAICDCVRPSKKRSCRIFRSRSSSALKPGASTARSSETSYWCSSVPIDSSGSRSSSPSPPPPPDESESDEYARPDSSASSTSSSVDPDAFASSGIVGERPSCTVSCSIRRESWTFSSCSPRGTRTDQPLSRKCRLISPMMFGVAYVVSSTPRSRSKRSIALIRPIAPIWTRSSSCSPRYEYRRASERTSDMYCSISCSRACRSPCSW